MSSTLFSSIKNFITKFFAYIKAVFAYIWVNKKRPKVFIPLIILILILIGSLKGGSKSTTYALFQVQTADFVQEVAVTGKVVPAQKVDLGFEFSGRLASINTEVGAKVKQGQVLANINNADYYANLEKSRAQYLSEQARLIELQNGTRKEEVAIAQTDRQTAEQNLAQAKLALVEEVKDAYAEANDAIKNKADTVFNNPRSATPELSFLIDNNTTLRQSLERQRVRITEVLNMWQVLTVNLTSSNITDQNISTVKSYQQTVQSYLNDLNTAVTSVNSVTGSSVSFIQSRTDINSARSNVNTSAQNLDTAITSFRNTTLALNRAEETLGLKKTGSTKEQIDAQRANAQSAAAGVSSASASLGKTVIKAPFDGIVTRIQYKAGESVAQSEPVITVMSDASFEIETFVSENDVPKLKIGQNAKATLDALGDAVVFDATVSQVDLSETVKDGVVTYKTRLQFMTRDERIKSGLTTNVVAETDRRSGVLKVPQTAIIVNKGKKYVKIAPAGTDSSVNWSPIIDKQSKEVPVTTGAIDRDGDIEIISGVNVGDIIVVKS